jgi:hypothetical protein
MRRRLGGAAPERATQHSVLTRVGADISVLLFVIGMSLFVFAHSFLLSVLC